MGRKKKEHVWLNRDQIVEKYYNSSELYKKLDIILYKFGVNRDSAILEDCISKLWDVMCAKPNKEVEYLYNEKYRGNIMGYLITTFKRNSMYTSTESPNDSIVSSLRFASSFACNASIDPSESDESHTDDGRDFTFIVDAEYDLEGISFNEIWTYLEQSLSTVEMRTLIKYFVNKRRPGVLKKTTKKYIDTLKLKVRKLILEFDNSYSYYAKGLDTVEEFKGKQTKGLKYTRFKKMDNKEYIQLCESVRQTAYDIINRKVSKITAEYKEALRKILHERFVRNEIQSTNVSWGCSDCVLEITHNFTAYLESQRYLDLVASITPPAPEKKSTKKNK